MTDMQRKVLFGLFVLLVSFILLFTTTYTLDLRFRLNTVTLLTACRIAMLVVGFWFLWLERKNLTGGLDLIAATLLAVILAGALSGLIEGNDVLAYCRHAFQYVFMLIFYLIGRSLARYDIPAFALRIITGAILFGYGVAIVICAITPAMQAGAYSFQPNLALLPLAQSGSWITSALSALVIIIGNKRAVFVGACFCAAVLIAFAVSKDRRSGMLAKAAAILVLSPVIALVTYLGLSGLNHIGVPFVGAVADRFSPAPSYSPEAVQSVHPGKSVEDIKQLEAGVDPMLRLTSARNIEATAVWNLLRDKRAGLLIGAGLGSEFEVEYTSPNDYQNVNFVRDQADVMPVHMAMTSGVPLAALFTIVLVWAFVKLFLRLDRIPGIEGAIALFSISLVPDTLLGFNGTNPLVWAAAGYAIRRG
jgi:hypothetical protein